ncbi:MAG: DUF2125 domain-containing protein [Pseudomonadota bacterium]
MAPRSRSAIKNVHRADQRRKAKTEAADSWDQTRSQRKVIWFGSSLLLVLSALVAGWFLVASKVNGLVTQELEALNSPDQTVACDGQEIVGFPFRMGLKCDRVRFESAADQLALETGALRTAAQVYAPRHQIIELKAPALLKTANALPLKFDWESARSSVRIDGNNLLQRVEIEASDVTATTNVPDAPARTLLSLERLFSVLEPYNARGESAATDLRFYLQGDAIAPAGLGIAPLNFEGTLALIGAASALADAEAWTASLPTLSEPIRLENVRLTSGETLIELSGRLDVSPTGYLNGTLRLAGQGLEEGLQALREGVDPRSVALKQSVDTLVPTILALAQPHPDNPEIRRAPPIVIRDGRVLLGLIPLGDIPPIQLGG